MTKIKNFIKNHYKIFIIYIIILVGFSCPLPYYIYAPGGIVNIKNRVTVENGYDYKGSFNLSYVSEYKGNIITMAVALINKNWDIFKKKDIVLDDESIKEYNTRDRLLLQSGYSNATQVAYKKANKKISITNSSVYVAYIYKESQADLKVGDKLISINNTIIKNAKHLNKMVNKFNSGDKISVKVLRDGKEIEQEVTLIQLYNKRAIGIGIVAIDKLKTEPHIKYSYVKDECGSSGGLMLSLAIYNSLTKKDITKGKTIVGTGTIDSEGNVGEIDGVKYKMKGAAKKHIDLFIVPNGNLKEAKKIKEKCNYKFQLIGVDTFDQVIEYLNRM